ncbi:hypothetical protein PRZ48_009655 [Zasmidium cellare]|uniref:Dihydroorotate dehydrogenase (quinone), mitochondrial n=1 Tax=Zasmidium cellare TaxID=395010 RepID=A0ABR0ED66_ZASCE|nr:hypothetical protein PRZ48_009655 [Zasmidium cellare]
MTIHHLPPKPGCQIKVIGAGLPRTGTNSFCAAVGILLEGPFYHAGAQFGGAGCPSEDHILMMDEAARCVSKPPAEKQRTLAKLYNFLDGYVATNDPPLTLLVPELMEMYPNAKVICTVRERDSWVKSFLKVVKTAQPTLAGFIFFWVPSMRYLPRLAKSLTHLFYERFGVIVKDAESAIAIWDRHHAWLEEVVPREKLVYYNVKDGWEPLCRALSVPVPDVPFPRLNDSKALDDHFKNVAVTGMMRWAMVLAAVVGVGSILLDLGLHVIFEQSDVASKVVRAPRLSGASIQLLRHTHGLNRSQWRSLQRQWQRQLSQTSRQPPLIQYTKVTRRWQSTTDAAKDAAKDVAKSASATAAKETAEQTAQKTAQSAKETAQSAKSTAQTAAKATASGGSRVIAWIYGTGLVLILSFGYLYITDTRASIHQYLVVPLVRFIHSDAEEAHHAGIRYIKGLYDFNLHPRERGNQDQELGDLKVEVFGHILDNPIGTSAGIDKNAEVPDALLALGPALVEVGGATPLPQEGNPKPRVFRIPSQNALINRYGLNSDGAEHVAMQLRERVRAFAYSHGMGLAPESERIILDGEAEVPPGSLVPGKLLAVQVAKNKTTPDNDIAAIARDYVFCVERLAKYADVLVVNVSSPNTPGLRDLQATGPLTAILTAVVDSAKSVDRRTKPAVMVKVSPDEDSDSQIEGICNAVWSSGVDGVIVGNTTKKRPDPVPSGYILPGHEAQVLTEVGGYSGPQMFQHTLDLVKRYRYKLDQGPQEEASAPTYPSQAPPVDDTKSSITETVKRDADRLKPDTAEADEASKQPLVKLPERHTTEDVSEKAKSISEAAKTDSPLSASSPQTPPALAEGEKGSTRQAAEGALQKIITDDGAGKQPSPSAQAPVASTKKSPADSPSKVIFATGGITNGEQCLEILNAGASICQVYTAMMYGGVGTVTRMKGEMREAIRKQSGKS